MNLIVDTCGAALVVALARGPAITHLFSQEIGTGHAEAILPAFDALLERAGLARFTQFEKIGVCVGPGSFTGLRVGLAMARARAAVSKSPLVALNRLQCIASTAAANETVRVEIDARRGEHFVQRFSGQREALCEPFTIANDDLPNLQTHYPNDTRIVDVGNQDVFAQACAALTHTSGGEPHGSVVPLYVRPPDAKAQPALLFTRR